MRGRNANERSRVREHKLGHRMCTFGSTRATTAFAESSDKAVSKTTNKNKEGKNFLNVPLGV